MRHFFLSSIFLLLLTCLSQAQAADSVKAQVKAAKKACAAGDFRKGVEILAGLYVDTDDLTHVYNQARCYEQNHQWLNSIDRFREYLRKAANLSSAEKDEVEKHIADCEAFKEKDSPNIAPPPALATIPVTASAAPPPSPSKPSEPKEDAVAESAQHGGARAQGSAQGSGLRVTGIVLGSVGVVALATGLVLNLKANNLATEFNNTHNSTTQSSRSSYKTGSMICYGAGVGALLAGGVLYLIGRSGADERMTQISFYPVLALSEFSLTLRKAF